MFTSNLSVNEFVLLERENTVLLGQVTGNSSYRLDSNVAQKTPRLNSGEIKTLTKPSQDAYRQALDRCRQTARKLGADAVVSLRLAETRKFPDLWHPANRLTVQAIGTAARLDIQERPAEATLLTVSGQEYSALRQAGLMPVGLVLGQCVYFQKPESRLLFSTLPRNVSLLDFERTNVNCERTDYTKAITKSRRLAVGRMETEATHLKAAGIVGISVTMRSSWIDAGLLVECLAQGTAVIASGQAQAIVEMLVPLA